MSMMQPDSTAATTDKKLIPPVEPFVSGAHCNSLEQYEQMYQRSISDPDAFWLDIASEFEWRNKPTKGRNASFDDDVSIKWFEDGTTNIKIGRAHV